MLHLITFQTVSEHFPSLLKGSSEDMRLRVGDFRVRYTDEQPDTLRIHTVKHRKDSYRN